MTFNKLQHSSMYASSLIIGGKGRVLSLFPPASPSGTWALPICLEFALSQHPPVLQFADSLSPSMNHLWLSAMQFANCWRILLAGSDVDAAWTAPTTSALTTTPWKDACEKIKMQIFTTQTLGKPDLFVMSDMVGGWSVANHLDNFESTQVWRFSILSNDVIL